jgi:hypothetical protein
LGLEVLDEMWGRALLGLSRNLYTHIATGAIPQANVLALNTNIVIGLKLFLGSGVVPLE